MKKTFKLLMVATFILAGLAAVQAQPGGEGMGRDPEKRAEQQTATMTEKLSLSEAQTAKVKEINLKYATKIKEVRDNAGGDREAMRAAMTALRDEQDKELKAVLTDEQWQQWVKIREEQRRNRGGFGGEKPGEKPEKQGGGDEKKG